MMRTTRRTLGCAGLTAAMIGLIGCTSAEPQVQWQADGTPVFDHPNSQWWSYKFIYHPEAQVYYEPYSGTYYWYQADGWYEGTSLPADIPLEWRIARVVRLNSPRPFVQHSTVLASHPTHRDHPLWHAETTRVATEPIAAAEQQR